VDRPDEQERRDAEERQAFVRHELRTPLAVMRPLVDMLLDGSGGQLDERQIGYMRMLDRNLDRLTAMIASVVESGWLESAALPAATDEVSVRALLEETVADVCRALHEHPRVETDFGGDLPTLRGDPQRLRRALRNVLLNACHFTPPAGTVTVRARVADDGSAVSVTFADTGQGIEADELDRVFDFGFQGKAGRSRPDRGLGLGLFVAREIVAAHGGRIWLESSPGEGTRVSLELPGPSA